VLGRLPALNRVASLFPGLGTYPDGTHTRGQRRIPLIGYYLGVKDSGGRLIWATFRLPNEGGVFVIPRLDACTRRGGGRARGRLRRSRQHEEGRRFRFRSRSAPVQELALNL